jgi:hypothetical protein
LAVNFKLLITIKTYPVPSKKYEEVVCTAGITAEGDFIRLFPIDFRSIPYDSQFKKYQWVDVIAEKNTRDNRPESYRPQKIVPVGNPIDSKTYGKSHWQERSKIVLAKPIHTMCELNSISQSSISLGLVKPRKVCDFTWEETEREWEEWQLAIMRSVNLFGPSRRPLNKIPYKFSYYYFCQEAQCKGHHQMIEDWEVGALYRNMVEKYTDEKIACAKVRERFFDSICCEKNNLHFYVGTVLGHGTYVIVGLFYPPY